MRSNIASSSVAHLPSCGEAALAHSRKLQALIRDEIVSAGGWISFEHYMERALYAPGLGYYNGGATKLGSGGDFVTAPEISTLFGHTLARQVEQIADLVRAGGEQADILEFGAGSGKLARDVLQALERRDCLPPHYFILEVSADLRERQQGFLNAQVPHLSSRVVWLECLPDRFCGTILVNEVLDAMPVHLIEWQGGDVLERGVIWRESTGGSQMAHLNGAFAWQGRPLADEKLLATAEELRALIDPGNTAEQSDGVSAGLAYVSEINRAAGYFMHSLAKMLQQGAVILIDYGFGRSEYYHPQRDQGTLMCHYRHHAHTDPFYLPGLQDITSHVDFSGVYTAAQDAGLALLGYVTQAHFLLNCGVTEILSQTPANDVPNYLPLANQLQKLVSPAEMGELFKVIAFGKGIDQPLNGFLTGDKSRLL